MVGAHVLLNRGVLVGHHTTIGDYVTLQPGANVAGLCAIGERAFVGMGAIVIDRRTIGAEAISAPARSSSRMSRPMSRWVGRSAHGDAPRRRSALTEPRAG